MKYTVRPISDRTWLNPAARTTSRFEAAWSATLELLEREIEHLDGSRVVLEVDVAERAIRNDGMLRADAKAGLPVVVAFSTPKLGDLIYQCDRYDVQWASQGPAWQHNVRAIALHLQSQRDQSRWGVTGAAGGTYGGFKAIGAGRAMPASHMTADDAAALLERVAIGNEGQSREMAVARILGSSEVARDTWRHARAMAHPDRRGGDRTVWDQVEQAAVVLGVTR